MKKYLAVLLLSCSAALGQGFGSFPYDLPYMGVNTTDNPKQDWFPSIPGWAIRYNIDMDSTNSVDGAIFSNLVTTNVVRDRGGFYAYDLISKGDECSYWTNNSGILNNLGFMTMDWTNSTTKPYMETNFTTTFPQPWTAFIVMYDEGAGATKGVFGSLGNAANVHNATFMVLDTGVFNGCAMQNSGVDSQNWKVWSFKANGASSEIRTNGVAVGSNNSGTLGFKGITFGTDNGHTVWPHFYWAYFLLYTNNLTTQQTTNIALELARHYAITNAPGY